MRNFREFDIWKSAVKLAKDAYSITGVFPSSEKYGLASQIQRAAVSIASNIAEGSSRHSEIDFARSLEISLGSSFELETQMIIAKELGFVPEDSLRVTFPNWKYYKSK
jgi:four helix bundle protein